MPFTNVEVAVTVSSSAELSPMKKVPRIPALFAKEDVAFTVRVSVEASPRVTFPCRSEALDTMSSEVEAVEVTAKLVVVAPVPVMFSVPKVPRPVVVMASVPTLIAPKSDVMEPALRAPVSTNWSKEVVEFIINSLPTIVSPDSVETNSN